VIPFRELTPFLDWVALVFGLVIGSFANVCIHRLPREKSIVRPGSSCPRCGAPIPPWANIPVLSYVVLLGRCRACRSAISPRYPLVELANGLAYFAIARIQGPSASAVALMAYATMLIILTFIDLEHYLLPDAVTLPGVAIGLSATLLPEWPVSFMGAAAAAAGGYCGFAAVAFAYRRLRGIEGLGRGDWKMAAMIGAFTGWETLLLVVFLAACAGTLVGLPLMAIHGRGLKQRVPFGSFLAVGAFVALFVGRPLIAWYKGFFRV
jgi:leader peptidase (prepilin peptidase)/N-methyltransferase